MTTDTETKTEADPNPVPKLSAKGKTKQILGGTMVAIPALWLVAAIVTAGVMVIPDNFSWSPTYNREVHSHLENAYYANTPELMVKELKATVDGMHRLGLDGYCDMRPWKQVASCHMDWQYDHLDSIIRRAEAVRDDRDRQIREGGSDQLADVYETKMDNLRAFIKEDGWSDGVAYDAFYVEHHPFYAAFYDYFAVALGAWLATTLLLGGGGIILFVIGSKQRDEARNQYAIAERKYEQQEARSRTPPRPNPFQ